MQEKDIMMNEPLNHNVKDINGTNLSSNVLFEGEPTNTLMQTNNTPDFKASAPSCCSPIST